MTKNEVADKRKNYCPVYDIECPDGAEAANACDNRFAGNYNPLTSFRDADIEHCAIYRKEQQDNNEGGQVDPSHSDLAKE